MVTAKLILVILHITFGAIAFGALLGGMGALRRAQQAGPEALGAAAREHNRRSTVTAFAWTLVFASGVGLILLSGGFRVMPANYHAAMGLVAIATAVAWLLDRPAARKLLSAQGAEVDGLRARAAMTSGIQQALWLATLVLMYVYM